MTTPTTARRARLVPSALAPLAFAATLAASPAPARASPDDGTGSFEIGCAALATVSPIVVIAVAGLASKSVYEANHVGFEIALLVGGAMGVGFGATGTALQARHTGGCNASCKPVYGFSIAGMAFGALAIGMGIASAINPRLMHGRAWLTPVPVLIPTERGPVVGAGLSGVLF